MGPLDLQDTLLGCLFKYSETKALNLEDTISFVHYSLVVAKTFFSGNMPSRQPEDFLAYRTPGNNDQNVTSLTQWDPVGSSQDRAPHVLCLSPVCRKALVFQASPESKT